MYKKIKKPYYINIKKKFNLLIFAQEASMGAPIGPTLGQAGVKIQIQEFCKQFNKNTEKYPKGLLLKVHIYIYKNGKFKFFIKYPPITYLVNNIIIFNKNKLNYLDIYKIALLKNNELKYLNIKNTFKCILNSLSLEKIK